MAKDRVIITVSLSSQVHLQLKVQSVLRQQSMQGYAASLLEQAILSHQVAFPLELERPPL